MEETRLLHPYIPAHQAEVLRLWQAAAHPNFPLAARLLAYNTAASRGETLAGRVAVWNGEVLGVVLACALAADPPYAASGDLGWVSLLAVHPSAQGRGVGSALLEWAENWLQGCGVRRVRLGGNLRPFGPGLPVEMQASLPFLARRGYQAPASQPYEYDLARDLEEYRPRYDPPPGADLRPMQGGQGPALLEFLGREYPGRWTFEAEEFVRLGGRPGDYLLLWLDGRVEGFCRLTLPDSERPIERFYPQRLPAPWGQLGPLGLSKAARGRGLGGYLIDAAACHLRTLGVVGCVIDWTSLTALYAKFGFQIYHQYHSLFKTLPC